MMECKWRRLSDTLMARAGGEKEGEKKGVEGENGVMFFFFLPL